jgi:hypothetical protein
LLDSEALADVNVENMKLFCKEASSTSRIIMVLDSTRFGKCPGADGVCSEVWRLALACIYDVVSDFFTRRFCSLGLSGSEVPASWRHHLCFLIPKTHPLRSIDELREIAVISDLTKTFLRSVTKAVEAKVPSVSYGAAGGMPGWSCAMVQTQISLLKETCDMWPIPYVIVKIDVSKAYSNAHMCHVSRAMTSFDMEPSAITCRMREHYRQSLDGEIRRQRSP